MVTTVIYLLITALVFFFIGYFVGKSCEDKSTSAIETIANNSLKNTSNSATSTTIEEKKIDESISTATEQTPLPKVSNGKQPITLLTHPRNNQKDNLTRIKGIGVKIEEGLNGIGIYHFDQISAWTEDNIIWADKKLNLMGRIVREKWIDQAKLLAQGEETEFSKRVDDGKVSTSKKE